MMITDVKIATIQAMTDLLFFRSEIKAVIAVITIKTMNKLTVGIPSNNSLYGKRRRNSAGGKRQALCCISCFFSWITN